MLITVETNVQQYMSNISTLAYAAWPIHALATITIFPVVVVVVVIFDSDAEKIQEASKLL